MTTPASRVAKARHREAARPRPAWATWPGKVTHWLLSDPDPGTATTNHTHLDPNHLDRVQRISATPGATVPVASEPVADAGMALTVQGASVSKRKGASGRDRHPLSAQWLALPQKQRKFSVYAMAVGAMVLAFNLVLAFNTPSLDTRALTLTVVLFGVVMVAPGIWLRRGEEYFQHKFWEYPLAVSLVFTPAYIVAAVLSLYVGVKCARTFILAPEKRLRAPVDFAAMCVGSTVGCAIATISEPLTYPLGALAIVGVRDGIMFFYDESRGGRAYALRAWKSTWLVRMVVTAIVSTVAAVMVYALGPQREFFMLAPLSVLFVFWAVQYRASIADEKSAWQELERVTGKFVAQTDDFLLAQTAVKTGLTLFSARHAVITLYADGNNAATQWSLTVGPNQRMQHRSFAASEQPEPPAQPASHQKVRILSAGTGPIGWMMLEWDPQAPVRSSRDSLTTTYGHVVASSLANTLATKLVRQEAMEKSREAEMDPLTGLGNRLNLANRGPIALAESQDVNSLSALILLDLDGFKRINDSLGHGAGDQVLVEVARRLQETVRQSDLAIRLGGDEFAILARDLRFVADAEKMTSKIVRALIPPVEVEELQLSVETSIGYAISPHDATDIDTLLKRADIALYKSKAKGRGMVSRFTTDIDFETTDSLRLATDLRRAIVSRNELVVYYQPQVDLQTEKVTGVEALVRWQHPTEGLLMPDKFVHVAEQSNLIGPFTKAILQRALAGRQQMRKVLPFGTVSVNLSAHNLLDQSLPMEVERLLEQYNIQPHELVLEVTETAAAGDAEAAGKVLANLARLGCKVAMDDFGTGYATLDTLRSGAPIREIKMDRGFVKDVAKDPRAVKVAKAIIDIAHAFECSMVAEGIEDVETLEILRELGCDHAQGYYWMKPSPLPDVMDWIGAHTQRIRALNR
jgi:diguanylate cyclase (GGDEF)-like protein